MNTIFENADIYIERELSEIPWVKIFTRYPYKELTDCPKRLRKELYECCEIIEKMMREYYRPEKINIASFGNYVPHLHIHVMARFKEDSYFPEPMWGQKQRDATLRLPPFETFADKAAEAITRYFKIEAKRI